MVDLHGQYERIREEINNAIQEVLDTTAFINGPQVKTFAQHLAEYNQVEHVVPVPTARCPTNCFMALGLQPGDEVIVPVILTCHSRDGCPFTVGTYFRGLCRRPFHN